MRTVVVSLAYLGAIIGAELTTNLVPPLGGSIFYVVILFLLTLNSMPVGQHPSHRLFLTLGLATVIRILSLSMTLAGISQIYCYPVLYIPLLVGIFSVIAALNLNPREIGLTAGVIPIQGLIALTGIGFGLIDCFIPKPEPFIMTLTGQEVIAPAFIILLSTGFIGEIAFLGLMQRSAMEALGSWGRGYILYGRSILVALNRAQLRSTVSIRSVSGAVLQLDNQKARFDSRGILWG